MGLSTRVCICMPIVYMCVVYVRVAYTYPLEVHLKSSIVFMTVKR